MLESEPDTRLLSGEEEFLNLIEHIKFITNEMADEYLSQQRH